MHPTNRLQPIGLITFLCAFILGVGLFALSPGSTIPSASASLRGAHPNKGLPQASPTTPPGCVLDWSIVNSPSPGANYNKLEAISVISANDAWAVGSHSLQGGPLTLIEHWNGTEWTVVPSPNPGTGSHRLTAIDAVSADDIWAVGNHSSSIDSYGLFMHWDGTTWNLVSSEIPNLDYTLDDVEAVSATDAWAVGYYQDNNGGGYTRPIILHWDGVQWRVAFQDFYTYGELHAIHASSPGDIWAVGYSFTDPSFLGYQTYIMHWDGLAWTRTPSPNWASTTSILYGVGGASTNDVWSVGYSFNHETGSPHSLILHWDGTIWAAVPSPSPVGQLEDFLLDVTAFSADDAWAVGISSALPPGEGWLLAMRWDGISWSVAQLPHPPTTYSILYGVAGSSPADIWAVGTSDPNNSSFRTLVEHYSYTCSTPAPTETGTPMTATSTYTPAPTLTPVPTSTLPATSTSSPAATATSTHTSASTPTHTTAPTHTVTSTLTPIPCSMQFVDVHPGDYFYDPVRYLYCEGFISGYADNSFRPWNVTTRAQLAKIVVSAKGWQLLNPQSPAFMDVPANSTFYQFIETASSHGIITGYPCGNPEPCDAQNRPYFRPNTEITRGQLTKIIVAAQGWPLLDSQTSRFADVAKGSTFYMHIETAVSHGIIAGYPCGNPVPCDPQARPYFRPGSPATRGQIARIVYNAITSP